MENIIFNKSGNHAGLKTHLFSESFFDHEKGGVYPIYFSYSGKSPADIKVQRTNCGNLVDVYFNGTLITEQATYLEKYNSGDKIEVAIIPKKGHTRLGKYFEDGYVQIQKTSQSGSMHAAVGLRIKGNIIQQDNLPFGFHSELSCTNQYSSYDTQIFSYSVENPNIFPIYIAPIDVKGNKTELVFFDKHGTNRTKEFDVEYLGVESNYNRLNYRLEKRDWTMANFRVKRTSINIAPESFYVYPKLAVYAMGFNIAGKIDWAYTYYDSTKIRIDPINAII